MSKAIATKALPCCDTTQQLCKTYARQAQLLRWSRKKGPSSDKGEAKYT